MAQSRGRSFGAFVVLLLGGVVGVAGGQPVQVSVDPVLSSFDLTLEVDGISETVSAPLLGGLQIDPSGFDFWSYGFFVGGDPDFVLSDGSAGTLDAQLSDGALLLDGPLSPLVIESEFVIEGFNEVLGFLGYEATGDFCASFQDANLPCDGVLDLFTPSSEEGFTLEGTIVLDARYFIVVEATISGTVPLVADDPALGVLTAVGSFYAEGDADRYPECTCDLNFDFVVDSDDLLILLSSFGTSDAGDVTYDGVTDSFDLEKLLANWSGAC